MGGPWLRGTYDKDISKKETDLSGECPNPCLAFGP